MDFWLLTLGIFTALISFISTLLGGTAGCLVGGFSTALTILAAVLQYRLAQPYVRDISLTDWIQRGNEFEFTIPAGTHRRGKNPHVAVSQFEDGAYQTVITNVQVAPSGEVIIRVTREPRALRAVVK